MEKSRLLSWYFIFWLDEGVVDEAACKLHHSSASRLRFVSNSNGADWLDGSTNRLAWRSWLDQVKGKVKGDALVYLPGWRNKSQLIALPVLACLQLFEWESMKSSSSSNANVKHANRDEQTDNTTRTSYLHNKRINQLPAEAAAAKKETKSVSECLSVWKRERICSVSASHCWVRVVSQPAAGQAQLDELQVASSSLTCCSSSPTPKPICTNLVYSKLGVLDVVVEVNNNKSTTCRLFSK